MHYESQKILDNILNQTDLKLNTENFSPRLIVEKSQNRRNALNLIQEKYMNLRTYLQLMLLIH